RFGSYGYQGTLVLVALGKEVLAFRSGDLRPCPYPVEGNCEPMANGDTIARYSNLNSIGSKRLAGQSYPVVVALDSRTTRTVGIYRKKRSGWEDVSDDIGWVETAFSVARG